MDVREKDIEEIQTRLRTMNTPLNKNIVMSIMAGIMIEKNSMQKGVIVMMIMMMDMTEKNTTLKSNMQKNIFSVVETSLQGGNLPSTSRE